MRYWYPSHPEYATYLDRARDARAEALARAAYLGIDGVARLAGAAGAAIATAARSATDAVRRGRRRRAALRTLDTLDDRTLKDIGIDRAEIPRIVDDLLRAPAPDGTPVPAETAAPPAATADIRQKLAA